MPNFTITIDAPAEMIFDEIAHVERHPSWANHTAHMTMEQTAGDSPGTASHYVSHGVFLKKPISADIEITAFEPPRVFSLKATQHQEGKKDTWVEHTFTVSGGPDGTRVTKHMTGEPSVKGAVLGVVAYPAIRKDAMASLTNLKTMMESKAKAGGTV
jgi:uncharacterized protein YndB with AHSA1/START domain